MKLHGSVTLPALREIVTWPSSSGWRITSRADRLNSGSSSRKRTPLWAREISPGPGMVPPPSRPTSEMVWCGERKGRQRKGSPSVRVRPAAEWMLSTSRNSSIDGWGMMVGIRLATIDFPAPGGPSMRRLCAPATATSTARRSPCWPFTSEKSPPGSLPAPMVARYAVMPPGWGVNSASPVKKRYASSSECTG